MITRCKERCVSQLQASFAPATLSHTKSDAMNMLVWWLVVFVDLGSAETGRARVRSQTMMSLSAAALAWSMVAPDSVTVSLLLWLTVHASPATKKAWR